MAMAMQRYLNYTRRTSFLAAISRNGSEVSSFAAPRPYSSEAEKPKIEIEFTSPTPAADGSYPVDKVTTISGEKLLRNIMLDNKIDLYPSFRKVLNCGGRGLCGTCVVEVVEGMDLLSERTSTENKKLKWKSDSWRLACQTMVGNKENSGKVVVQRMPAFKE